MHDRTCPCPDADPPEERPTLLDQDWLVMEARRVRAQQAEAARRAEIEHTHALDSVGNQAEADVPLPFATPPGAAPTF